MGNLDRAMSSGAAALDLPFGRHDNNPKPPVSKEKNRFV